MIWLYRILYFFARLMMTTLQIVLPRHLKNWVQLRHRAVSELEHLGQSTAPQIDRAAHRSIWFHAASGEIEYVKNIVYEIKKLNPQLKVVVTYSSPSAERLLANMRDFVDTVLPLPWDQIGVTERLIRLINPRVLVFAKTDFWPELIDQTKKQNIRVGVVSVSMNEKIGVGFFQMWALKKMDFIFTSNPATTELLKPLRALTSSDTRFDQVYYRLSQPTKFNLNFSKPTIAFGSTWPDDDDVLIAATERLLELGYQLVWCPHDVDKAAVKKLVQKLQTNLKEKEIFLFSDFLNLKSNQTSTFKNDILVIDQIGLLADIYRYSEFAFIGGSFKSKIHSVMEALCAGNIVFFGPKHHNNSEAVEFSNLNLAFPFDSADQLLHQLQALTPTSKIEIKQKIQLLCLSKKGASKKIAQYLLT